MFQHGSVVMIHHGTSWKKLRLLRTDFEESIVALFSVHQILLANTSRIWTTIQII